MTVSDTIRVVDLLMERERAFVDVHRAEQQVERIVGAPYPFPDPPELPSLRKRPAQRGAYAQSPRLRGLQGEEAAYRVTYERNGERTSEVQTSLKLVRALAENQQEAGIRILSIETVRLDEHGQAVPVDR